MQQLDQRSVQERRPVHRLTVVVDLAFLPMSFARPTNLKVLKRIVQLDSEVYPETLKRVLLVRPPQKFAAVWKARAAERPGARDRRSCCHASTRAHRTNCGSFPSRKPTRSCGSTCRASTSRGFWAARAVRRVCLPLAASRGACCGSWRRTAQRRPPLAPHSPGQAARYRRRRPELPARHRCQQLRQGESWDLWACPRACAPARTSKPRRPPSPGPPGREGTALCRQCTRGAPLLMPRLSPRRGKTV